MKLVDSSSSLSSKLYFVISNDSYAEFKKQYPKVKLAGFWHSLFANGKINLTVTVDSSSSLSSKL
jgi:hypothetical protein